MQAYFYLDYAIGNLILFVWSMYQPKASMSDGPVVGSGLIAGTRTVEHDYPVNT